MATVTVSLIGPSQAAVQAKLEQVARKAGVHLSPYNVTAQFTAGAPPSTYEMTSSLHAPSLDDAQLRAKLEPFEDETADTHVDVRFVVLP